VDATLQSRLRSPSYFLTGGCFEHDLREHAVHVFSSGFSRAVTYDMRGDDDLVFGIGAGCEGCIRVFIEPGNPPGKSIRALALASELAHRGQPAALATIHEGPPEEIGTRLWRVGLEEQLGEPLASACAIAVESRTSQALRWGGTSVRQAWIKVVEPPPTVLICGAGPDTEPLVSGLRALRFPVTVVDHRPAYADPARFPGVAISVGPATSVAARIDLRGYYAAIVMSHHFPIDAVYLQALASTGIPYIGLLGPRARRAKLLEEIGAAAQQIEDRLHSPIGLDIGAVTPEGIALSIVSELHAVAAGRSGGMRSLVSS
jgi:xanthine dehydrogenase accessory factor